VAGRSSTATASPRHREPSHRQHEVPARGGQRSLRAAGGRHGHDVLIQAARVENTGGASDQLSIGRPRDPDHTKKSRGLPHGQLAFAGAVRIRHQEAYLVVLCRRKAIRRRRRERNRAVHVTMTVRGVPPVWQLVQRGGARVLLQFGCVDEVSVRREGQSGKLAVVAA